MCLITFAYKVHPRFPLIVAANRDEFRDRPAAPAAWWSDGSGILAGRDLRAGGTWLGMTQQGRFAALTNHRDLSRPLLGGPSRGALVRNALMGSFSTDGTAAFDGFNLLYGTVGALRYHNNIDASDTLLNPGLHGLSNALLNTPWPKVERAKAALEKALHLPDEDLVSALFALLRDDEPAPVEDLPTTGLRLDMERAVSSIFIDTPGYGTRCSTVLLVNGLGRAHFEERSWPSGTSVVFDPTIDLRTEPTV